MKKLIVLILCLSLFAFTGCSSQEAAPEDASQETPAEAPQEESQIIIALQSDGKSLDPHIVTDAASSHIAENMYTTLMAYTPVYGEVAPLLAKEYTVSDDKKTYAFVLNEGVKFHNSEKEVAAEDVKYSIERIISLEVRKEHFAAVESIDTPDKYTVVFNLKEPFAPFLTYLAYPMNAVVNKEVVEANGGKLDQVDAGSGPFQLVEWKKDQQAVLAKNPNYFEADKPKLDKVIFKPIPDETARATALRNKEIDLIFDVTDKEIMVLKDAADINIESVPGTFWEYLGLNVEKENLKDVKVRQAIANAVDREAINQTVKFGRATVLTTADIPPGHWAHADLKIYPERNLEKAKQLMKEAGKENGFKLTLKAGSDFKYQVDAAQMIKQQLKDINIEVEVLAQESGVFFDALGKGDFEMTVVGWLGFVDPDEYLNNIFRTGAVWNQQKYSNKEVDSLLDQGRIASTVEERKEIYAKIQKIIAEEAPMVFLYANQQSCAMLNHVKGFVVHPTVSSIFLKDTSIEK